MIKRFAFLLLGLCPLAVQSQTCNGSLGDPVLNETFGAGHVGLDAHKTSFPFVGGCPSKGTYTISNFIFGCGNNTWVQMTGDHTGDLNGNYMLVNAESQSTVEHNIVYTDTAKGLCPNTVYQYGMWVTPVMTQLSCNHMPVLPNLKYEIRTLAGVLLASDSTGKLPIVDSKSWRFFGLSIVTPPGITDAIVSITIDAPFGCGSGFALDDITVRPCGPLISATLDGSTAPADVCADYTNPWILNATYSPGFADPVLQWQSSLDSGKTWVDIAGQQALNYAVPHRTTGAIWYRVCIAERTNINSVKCRVVSNPISTTIHPLPVHQAPRNTFGCLDKKFVFTLADPDAIRVLWTGPNGYSSADPKAFIPNIQYTDTGLYKLQESYNFGCVSLDTVYLKVFPGTTLTVQPSYPICEGKTEQLITSASDSVGYQWTPAVGLSSYNIASPLATPTDSMIYKVVITNKYGCKDSANLPINVYRNPVASAGPDKTILKGDTATLNGIVKGTAVDYYWSPASFMSDDHATTPYVFPPANNVYTLYVTSTVGCGAASDDVLVKVYNSFFVPNSFTPNGDGNNDKFRILMLDNYKLSHLLIYNRWGQLVFKSEGVYNGWDGTFKGQPQPAGVYVYHLEIQAPFRDKIVKQGTILLLR